MRLMTEIPPHHNESIRSYLTRLTLANDYLVAKHLFDEYSENKHISINSCEESLFEFAQQIAGIEDTGIFSPIPSEEAAIGSKGQLGYRTLMDKNPHVCPACMASQNHTLSHWQLYPITHCQTHDMQLISHCMCGEKLNWNEELLNYGCSECDASWREIAALRPRSETPAYVRHFHQVTNEETTEFIEDLLTASMRALRPFDSVHHGIKQLPNYVSNWSELCDLAYKLLTDKDTIEHWCSSMLYTREHYSILGDKATFYPIITMQERLHNKWLVSGFTPKMCNIVPSAITLQCNHVTACSARNKSMEDCSLFEKDEQLINHLDQSGFAKMLGCDLALSRELFKIPSISTVTKVGRGRFSFIDISDFINQTKDQNTAKQHETSSLGELHELLEMYTLTSEELLVEIYKHELPIYIDLTANSLVDTICINETVLADFLETTYLNNEANVSISRAMRILSISRNQVIQLGKMAYLDKLPSKPSTPTYSGKSIAHFLTNYVCIERWAAINHACHGKVTKAIKDQGILFSLAPFIYKKSLELNNLLANYSGHLWQAQEQLTLFEK